jgi:hypothetical protein
MQRREGVVDAVLRVVDVALLRQQVLADGCDALDAAYGLIPGESKNGSIEERKAIEEEGIDRHR